MRGNGTRPAITINNMPPAHLLDLTRTLRRAGRLATGVDRVELAYLNHFARADFPAFGIIRTPFGYLLLDKAGLQAFQARLTGQVAWGRATLLSKLVRGRSVAVQHAESDLRRFAVGRCTRSRLPHLLYTHLLSGFAYYNVGHSNLTERMLAGVKSAGGRVHAMIHDVIPLEYPQYQRAETIAPFRAKIARVSAHADRVIYNSRDTQRRTEPYLAQMGRIPPFIVAHLGAIPPVVDAAELPSGLPPERPYFMTLGTIEPRKNHEFLLDLWDQMGPDAPPLLICGSRGWNNDAVFSRLDALDPSDPVCECTGLTDAAIGALLENAAGVLFPSLAEGYGLPQVESLQAGARVLCNNLPVFEEIAGENANYLSVSDPSLWLSTVKEWEKNQPTAQGKQHFEGPQWRDHFKIVLSLT